jgi:hypothetical protein
LRIRAFVVSSNIQKALSMQVPVLVDDILAWRSQCDMWWDSSSFHRKRLGSQRRPWIVDIGSSEFISRAHSIIGSTIDGKRVFYEPKRFPVLNSEKPRR